MTKATWIQLGIGAVVALGLITAVVWRAPSSPPVESRESASKPDSGASVAEEVDSEANSAPPLPDLQPPKSAIAAPLDEASLMMQLRHAAEGDRPRAIQLARDGAQRFPDSPSAPERTSILVHALASEGQASEARGTAEMMVNHYPDSSWVREIEQFTGAHRHRNLRLNADGGIESY